MRATPLLLLLLAGCGAPSRPATVNPTPAPSTTAEEERKQPPLPIEAPAPAKEGADAPPPISPPPPPPPPPLIQWREPVAKKTVPRIYLTVHARAENRATCPLLVLTDLGEGAGAKPRKASFAGGWAVAYDKAGAPGKDRSGEACATCGRSAFGVAGTGVSAKDGSGPEWPNRARWDDGSTAGYGPEGGDGPTTLAYVTVKDADCLYNVWSALGPQHLEVLLTGLRRVAP